MVENFRGFRGLASNREGFPANFFFFIIRCFESLYNRESFPANNKIMQSRKFSTANDLHYTVYSTKLPAEVASIAIQLQPATDNTIHKELLPYFT